MNQTDFRWHLRQLPREREPARDLWPAIAAAIGGHDVGDAVPKGRPGYAASHRSHALRWASGMAVAVLLASAGYSIPHWRLAHSHAPRTREHRLVLKEAASMRKQYKAQFARFSQVQVPANIAPALDELDASADAILKALDVQPDDVFLLDQLRRTYARRLELTQRMAVL